MGVLRLLASRELGGKADRLRDEASNGAATEGAQGGLLVELAQLGGAGQAQAVLAGPQTDLCAGQRPQCRVKELSVGP